MGAACAAIGAVGLFHVEGLTPEAVEQKRVLLRPNHQTYVVDDAELGNLMASYPVKWKNKIAAPQKCFIGCPHLSLRELYLWSDKILEALNKKGCRKLAVRTILCAAPQVIQKFRNDANIYDRLRQAGVRISSTCPEAYLENKLCAEEAIITNSTKLQTFTPARMFLDDQLLEIIVSGQVNDMELTDEEVMHQVRQDLDIATLPVIADGASGIAAKCRIAELLDIELNSVNRFKAQLGFST